MNTSRMTRAILLSVCLTACKATPTLDGQPLTCSNDSTCPEGLRCYQGGCVSNEPPELEHLGLRFTAPGQATHVTAVTSDAEGDLVEVTWSKTGGPALGTELDTTPLTGDTLSLTPYEIGTYTFEAVADDGYDSVTSHFTVVVIEDPPPSTSLVYVADAGEDSVDCGTPDVPCASLDYAAGRGDVLIVAANQVSTSYASCLSLASGESVWGGFDASTWRYDPVLIERTEINCERDGSGLARVGHTVDGSAIAAQVTLALRVGNVQSWPAEGFTTVALSGTGPRLICANVVGPAVSQPSTSNAVLSTAAGSQMLGVNVSGDPGALNTPEASTGILVLGGSAEISGLHDRGSITLNIPTVGYAVGIQSFGSTLSIDGIDVVGGVAGALIGAHFVGGEADVSNSRVELTSFGTFVVYGIATSSLCGDAACDRGAPVVGSPDPPRLTLSDNVVSVEGTPEGGLVPTCLAVGVLHLPVEDDVGWAILHRNNIAITGNVGLALGLATAEAGITADSNTIAIGRSLTALPGCSGLAAEAFARAPTFDGAIGALILESDSGDTITGNTIAVGPHVEPSFGLAIVDAADIDVAENTIDVARGSAPADASLRSLAVGVDLDDRTVDPGASRFERNAVTVHDMAGRGIALRLRGRTPWYVINNALYGGDTPFNTGLSVTTRNADYSPWVLHNTIFGGTGLVSRAVHIELEVALSGVTSEKIGTFSNNLFDAGEGEGRRFVLDNRLPDNSLLGDGIDNLAQVAPDPRPRPVPQSALVTAVPGALNSLQVQLALPTSGSVASLSLKSGSAGEEIWAPARHQFTHAWMGLDTGTTPVLAVAQPGLVSVGRLQVETFGSFVSHRFCDSDGAALTPRAITVAEVVNGPPYEVVVTTAGADGTGRLWYAEIDQPGWNVATINDAQDPLSLNDPGFIDAVFDAKLSSRRFFIVDNPDDSPSMVVWPELGSTLPTLPTPVTAFAAGGLRGKDQGERDVYGNVVAAASFGGGSPVLAVWRLTDDLELEAFTFDPACAGTASTVAIANLELLVGCDDGAVYAYTLDVGGATAWNLALAWSYEPAARPPVRFVTAGYGVAVVAFTDLDSVDVTATNAADAAVDTILLEGDVSMRATAIGDARRIYRPPSHFEEAGVGVELGNCPLGLRDTPPSSPFDLSLVGEDQTALDCHNDGTKLTDPIEVGDDIDGDTRDGPTVDIGADEV